MLLWSESCLGDEWLLICFGCQSDFYWSKRTCGLYGVLNCASELLICALLGILFAWSLLKLRDHVFSLSIGPGPTVWRVWSRVASLLQLVLSWLLACSSYNLVPLIEGALIIWCDVGILLELQIAKPVLFLWLRSLCNIISWLGLRVSAIIWLMKSLVMLRYWDSSFEFILIFVRVLVSNRFKVDILITDKVANFTLVLAFNLLLVQEWI